MPAPVVTPQRSQQSPIKLFTETSYFAPELKPITFSYAKVSGTVEGESFVVDRSGPGAHVVFEGMQCPLRELRFRAPGEHRIDGRIAELELQLVHEILKYPEGHASAFVIISVMLEPKGRGQGPAHGLDSWVRGHFDAVATASPPRAGGLRTYEVDPSLYLPIDRGYFRYEGSLTTGEFDEFVAWVVLRDLVQVAGPGPLAGEPSESRIVQPLMRRFVLRSFPLIQ